MANAITHQRNILEIHKPVKLFYLDRELFIYVKKFELYLVTQSLQRDTNVRSFFI